MAIALALLLVVLVCGVAYHLRSMGDKAGVSEVVRSLATDRDKQMAPFHVRRFSDAIEQCDKPEQLPELERNLRYWRVVAQAEEMRP